VSVVSSFYNKEWLFWPLSNPIESEIDSMGRGKQTIIVPGPIPEIFLACGTKDRFFNTMSGLHKQFLELGIPHVWAASHGGHSWDYWASVLEKLLKFHLSQ
jgi:S-formylglutathione hydrolase FrmB